MDLFQLRTAFFLGGVIMSLGVALFLFFTLPGKTQKKTGMQRI
jgi:hypothetical protein